MAGFNGRELTIDWDATTLVGVRTRGMTNSNEMVDVIEISWLRDSSNYG